MKQLLKPSLVVFALYTSIAILETVRTKSWVAAVFFLPLAVVFLFLKNKTTEQE